MQAEADALTQRCTQLHDENVHLTSMLAQRDNELLGELAACRTGPVALGCFRHMVGPLRPRAASPGMASCSVVPASCASELEQTIEEQDGQLSQQKESVRKLAGKRRRQPATL